jgi:hypothetical protein
MNDNEFGTKVARYLNTGLSQIDDDKLARLRVARERAMDAFREPVMVTRLATAYGPDSGLLGWLRKPLFWVPALVLAAAAVTYIATSQDGGFDDVGELDAKLLTGELPIDAFLDKDFATWVSETGE